MSNSNILACVIWGFIFFLSGTGFYIFNGYENLVRDQREHYGSLINRYQLESISDNACYRIKTIRNSTLKGEEDISEIKINEIKMDFIKTLIDSRHMENKLIDSLFIKIKQQ
jgi:hypothetical protein